MKFAWSLIACAVLALVTVTAQSARSVLFIGNSFTFAAGNITGRDPRSLGDAECSAYELGFSRADVKALQQVAFDQLVSAGAVTAAATPASGKPTAQARCVQGR
jgi:hypothetical protein